LFKYTILSRAREDENMVGKFFQAIAEDDKGMLEMGGNFVGIFAFQFFIPTFGRK
jgi:hypothetical protein